MARTKKKKQSTTTTVAIVDVGGVDLKSLIHSHDEFFEHLRELIPSRFYQSNDDADSKPWYQGLSKAAKASLKHQSKQNLKLARRQRFDPDRQIGKTPDEGEDDDDSAKIEAKPVEADENKEKSVTYEELRQKLRRKIELLRGNRGEKKFDEKRVRYEGKRKRDGDDDGKEIGNSNEEDGEEGEEIIEYGKLRLGDEDENKNKKRKLPKAHELEKARKLRDAKMENPTVAERESWKSAAHRAMGVKVHDNPRLIKEGMRRDKKKKEKNAEKWKERVQTQEKMKNDRQNKRKENIVGRINEKKARKIAKREKKLTRPGFEGRKEGYITKE